MSNIRHFLVVAFVGAAFLGAAACGSGSSSPDAASLAGCKMSDAGITIAANHVHGKHAVTVTSVEVQAAADKTSDIMGVAPHTHTISVTAAEFTTLKDGGMIMVTSTSTEDHTHVVTISCQ